LIPAGWWMDKHAWLNRQGWLITSSISRSVVDGAVDLKRQSARLLIYERFDVRLFP